jgi:hypothetical protein
VGIALEHLFTSLAGDSAQKRARGSRVAAACAREPSVARGRFARWIELPGDALVELVGRGGLDRWVGCRILINAGSHPPRRGRWQAQCTVAWRARPGGLGCRVYGGRR